MISANSLSHPELGPVPTESGSFLSKLHNIPYSLGTTLETYSHLQPVTAAKLGLAVIGTAFSSYLLMRHGLDTGHTAPDYTLAGHTTNLAPTPSNDSWMPDTESTHHGLAVDETPTPTPTPEPRHTTPLVPTPVETTHSIPSPTISSHSKSPSPIYDDYPFGEQPTDGPMFKQSTDFSPVDALCTVCSVATLAMAGGLGLLFWRGKRIQNEEEPAEGRLRLIEGPGES